MKKIFKSILGFLRFLYTGEFIGIDRIVYHGNLFITADNYRDIEHYFAGTKKRVIHGNVYIEGSAVLLVLNDVTTIIGTLSLFEGAILKVPALQSICYEQVDINGTQTTVGGHLYLGPKTTLVAPNLVYVDGNYQVDPSAEVMHPVKLYTKK